MACNGLRRDLTNALHKASSSRERVQCPGLHIRLDDDDVTVDLLVAPVTSGPGGANEPLLHVVTLAESQPSAGHRPGAPTDPPGPSVPQGHAEESDPRILALRRELRANTDYLQYTNKEMETANEDLKSSNEELLSDISERKRAETDQSRDSPLRWAPAFNRSRASSTRSRHRTDRR